MAIKPTGANPIGRERKRSVFVIESTAVAPATPR